MKAALWLRVSDPGQQTAENQRAPLEAEAQRRGLEISKVYEVGESAYQGRHQAALSKVYRDARAGRFRVLLVWSLDRLSREGPAATLEAVNRLSRLGVQVVSIQEPWVEVGGELRDLLLAVVGWVARWESRRRSERTRAGLARARANGRTLGRPPGSRDRKRRKQSGYFRRWAAERESGGPGAE